MIVFGSLGEMSQGESMDLPVQGGSGGDNNLDRFQPVGPGGLQMKTAVAFPADNREDAEFIASRMDTDLIAEMGGNLVMLLIFPLKLGLNDTQGSNYIA